MLEVPKCTVLNYRDDDDGFEEGYEYNYKNLKDQKLTWAYLNQNSSYIYLDMNGDMYIFWFLE